MKKRYYEELQLKILHFYAEDVLTASNSDIEEDWEDENEYGVF